ncbi:glutaredoxin domain-containing protein [Leifsonia sp. H3M29-4]|uniref:glutaredoxin family protein n=1 Tax=Salinibacterium metalliresistens TaxID=3031321 RepID=UPI0023DC27D0|nr:glutaredoxin domain-containing protein [Salinibacterium metalliresistens]MDF1478300.1 glutaredoxin domain-containing protein [Salinibacterium metalliresistens]
MDSLIVYGKPDCTDFLRSKALLDSLEVPFQWHDIVASAEDAERAAAISGGSRSPVIVFADGSFQVEPTDDELAVKLGFPAPGAGTAAEVCEI